MLIRTQARASARALVVAALTGSAIGVTSLAAHGAGGATAYDQPHASQVREAGLRGPVAAHAHAVPGPQKRHLVKASILPEAPGVLPLTPIPYTAFRAPKPDKLEANERDVECLTRAVYFESRGDSDAGQAAVAQVVLNRARHPAFPKSVCGVVNQGVERGSCQFSFACRPTKVTDQREWRRAREVAERALDGHVMEEVGTATFFHAARINPGWKHAKVGRIGAHVFYRYAGARGAPSAFRGEAKPSLLDSIAKPIQAAFSKPVVATATEAPPPILAFPVPPAKPLPPAPTPVVDAAVAPAAPATPVTQPVATPAVTPPEPVLQPTAGEPAVTPSPAASSVS